jgi:hypothetical protein
MMGESLLRDRPWGSRNWVLNFRRRSGTDVILSDQESLSKILGTPHPDSACRKDGPISVLPKS